MSNSKKDFYTWLREKKGYAHKDANKTVSTIIMLEGYASRHSLENGALLDASLPQLNSFILIFVFLDSEKYQFNLKII